MRDIGCSLLTLCLLGTSLEFLTAANRLLTANRQTPATSRRIKRESNMASSSNCEKSFNHLHPVEMGCVLNRQEAHFHIKETFAKL